MRHYPPGTNGEPVAVPNEVAPLLGISPLTLRNWLRERYPRHPRESYSGAPWHLTIEQVIEAAHRFPPQG